MFFTLSKLEFKKGYLFYLILYLFFFFWSLSTLSCYFVFKNYNNLLNHYESNRDILILFFKSYDFKINENFSTELSKIFEKYSFKVLNEIEVLKDLELDEDLLNYLDESLKKYMPIGIKLKIKDLSNFKEIKENISSLEIKFGLKSYIVNEELYKKIDVYKRLEYVLFFLLIVSNLFFFVFFYFVNKSLNNYLEIYLNTFQLLGGSFYKLIFVRLSLTIIPFILLLFLSFYIYTILTKFFISIFPILTYFPNSTSFMEVISLVSYFLFISVIYPSVIIFISFKKI